MYTIGHGLISQEVFLDLLNEYGIEYLVDVRSQPYSKVNPSFNLKEMQIWLKRSGFIYLHLGSQLGGRPSDSDCYQINGKLKFEVIKEKSYFIQGLNRLKMAVEKNVRVALLCQEVNAKDCHRCTIIGRALAEDGIILNHIDHNGKIKDQRTAFIEATGGLNEIDLFGECF